jgi:hypothetical protein
MAAEFNIATCLKPNKDRFAMSASTSAHCAPRPSDPGLKERRMEFDPCRESWLGWFARLGTGLTPELLDLGCWRSDDRAAPASGSPAPSNP